MATFKRPIFDEAVSPSAEAEVKAVIDQGNKAAVSRFKRPVFGDAPLEKPKKEIPFAEGSTLRIANPFGDELDTGLRLSPGSAQFLAGAGKRFNDIWNRIKQVSGQFPEVQAEIDRRRVEDQPLMETTPAMFGYAAPDMIATALLTGPVGVAGKTLNFSKPVAIGALGAVEGLLTPTTSDEGAGVELLNATLGGAGGLFGNTVGKGIARAGGKALNAASGLIPNKVRRAAAARNITLPEPTWDNPEAQRLDQLLRANGIRSTIGDVDRTSGWRDIEDMLANFPLSGRRDFLKKQQAGVVKNIEDLQSSVGGKLTGNEGPEMADSLRRAHKNAKAASSSRFNAVERIAENDPTITKIKLNESAKELDNILAKSPVLLEEFRSNPFMRKLLGLERDLGQQNGLIIDPKSMKPFQWDQELTFPEAQYVRKQLGGWASKLRDQKANGNLPQGVLPEDVAKANQVFGAFERDLDTWGTDPVNSHLSDTWKEARKFHKENVLPYVDPDSLPSKANIIRDIVNNNVDQRTVPSKIVVPKDSNLATDFMNLSDAPGQAAAKRVLMDRITSPAISDDLESGLSTSKLLTNSSKFGHPEEAILSPQELALLQNSRDIAMTANRSSLSGSSAPQNGMRTIPWLVGGAGLGGTTYAASNYFDPEMSASNRLLASTIAPAIAVLGARGANAYTSSALGKGLHFLDPELGGVMGGLQRYFRGMGTGAGESAQDQFKNYSLGHRKPVTEDTE